MLRKYIRRTPKIGNNPCDIVVGVLCAWLDADTTHVKVSYSLMHPHDYDPARAVDRQDRLKRRRIATNGFNYSDRWLAVVKAATREPFDVRNLNKLPFEVADLMPAFVNRCCRWFKEAKYINGVPISDLQRGQSL